MAGIIQNFTVVLNNKKIKKGVIKSLKDSKIAYKQE